MHAPTCIFLGVWASLTPFSLKVRPRPRLCVKPFFSCYPEGCCGGGVREQGAGVRSGGAVRPRRVLRGVPRAAPLAPGANVILAPPCIFH
jgi:hypothetical protein